MTLFTKTTSDLACVAHLEARSAVVYPRGGRSLLDPPLFILRTEQKAKEPAFAAVPS
jgi:hypothetical protein